MSSPPALPASREPGQEAFDVGTVAINVGLGFGSGYTYGFGSSLKSIPGLSVSVEKGINNTIGPGTISIGGLLGYRNFHYTYPGTSYKANFDHLVLLGRGAYHYNFTTDSRLDTYAGVSLGLRYVGYKNTYFENGANGKDSNNYGGAELAAGIFAGARYYLTDNLGAFAELGYDMSYLKVGVSAKF